MTMSFGCRSFLLFLFFIIEYSYFTDGNTDQSTQLIRDTIERKNSKRRLKRKGRGGGSSVDINSQDGEGHLAEESSMITNLIGKTERPSSSSLSSHNNDYGIINLDSPNSVISSLEGKIVETSDLERLGDLQEKEVAKIEQVPASKVSIEELNSFKSTWYLKDDVELQYQVISEENTLSDLQGNIYSLDGLEPVNIYSNTLNNIIIDGVQQAPPKPSTFEKELESGHGRMLVSKDEAGNIETITIFLNNNNEENPGVEGEGIRQTIQIVAITPEVFVILKPEDIDYDKINSHFYVGDHP